jgi:hypothetical protein
MFVLFEQLGITELSIEHKKGDFPSSLGHFSCHAAG